MVTRITDEITRIDYKRDGGFPADAIRNDLMPFRLGEIWYLFPGVSIDNE